MSNLTERQLKRWLADRARQSKIFTFSTCTGSRGDWLRRCNNGVALRTYKSVKSGWY